MIKCGVVSLLCEESSVAWSSHLLAFAIKFYSSTPNKLPLYATSTIMSASLVLALAANAAGTNLVQAGNLQDAVFAFKDALMRIRSFVACDYPTEGAGSENCMLETIQAPHFDQSQESFAIFDQFFLPLPLMDSESLVLSRNEVDLLTGAFLYNYGLAQHLTNMPKFLKNASRLYELTAQIVQTVEPTNNASHLALAVANNMAAVALTSFNYASFEKFRGVALGLFSSTDGFHLPFFVSNFTTNNAVQARPAAAA
eukprot:scaffold4511_cov171-Amphora_coffeaeformis.AAC.39